MGTVSSCRVTALDKLFTTPGGVFLTGDPSTGSVAVALLHRPVLPFDEALLLTVSVASSTVDHGCDHPALHYGLWSAWKPSEPGSYQRR